jgi:AcrR family transcriptional regulator
MSTTYHHGDLPAALRAATAELVSEKGPSGFSLREVARRAGVSHAAPAHHFGDAEGMRTSVATEGFGKLADEMSAATEGIDDAVVRLHRTGAAYVRVARENPGHMALMMQTDLVRADDPDLLIESGRAFGVLQRVITMIRDQLNPELDIDSAATFCWASIQGLVILSPSLGDTPETEESRDIPIELLVQQFATYMIEGFAAR